MGAKRKIALINTGDKPFMLDYQRMWVWGTKDKEYRHESGFYDVPDVRGPNYPPRKFPCEKLVEVPEKERKLKTPHIVEVDEDVAPVLLAHGKFTEIHKGALKAMEKVAAGLDRVYADRMREIAEAEEKLEKLNATIELVNRTAEARAERNTRK